MITTQVPSIRVGKYLVSPLTRPSDEGGYIASVSIRSGQGSQTHDRIYRFAGRFATPESATRYAIAQGLRWVKPDLE